jgi:hypothetical protein
VLLEHPVVYTLGSSSEFSDILFSLKSEDLTKVGDSVHVPGQDGSDAFDIHRVQRGGKVTYHCPGQIVGYPIVDLARHAKVCVRVCARVCVCVCACMRVCGIPYRRPCPPHQGVSHLSLPPSLPRPSGAISTRRNRHTPTHTYTHTCTCTFARTQTHTQDIEWYLRTLEKVIIDVLGSYGVEAGSPTRICSLTRMCSLARMGYVVVNDNGYYPRARVSWR